MILLPEGARTVITAQPDHARASADVAAALRPEFFDAKYRDAVIAATAGHDAGWESWEKVPQTRPEGAPLGFAELDTASHLAIWRASATLCHERLGAFASALVIRHAQALTHGADEAQDDWYAGRIVRLSREAFHREDPAVRDWHLERGFRILSLCDAATLVAIAGWQGGVMRTLLDDDGRFHEVTVTLAEAWCLAVANWPFATPSVEIDVPVTVREPGEPWAGVLARFASGKRASRTLRLTPAG